MMRYIDGGFPLLFAHRGGAACFPENTIYAFRQAVARYQADAIELDIHMTADDEMVVIHDNTVDRTTDGTGVVGSLRLEELKRLDAGARFTRDGGQTWPYRGKGLKIPTLREVFTAFKGTDVGITIDVKQRYPGIEQKLYTMITDMGLMDQVLVNSGHPSIMRRFRKLNHQHLMTGADALESFKAWILGGLGMGRFYRPRADALQVPMYFHGLPVASEKMVVLSREKQIKLHIWTIDEVKDMEILLKLGVDGIMTDYPDRLLAVFRRFGYKI